MSYYGNMGKEEMNTDLECARYKHYEDNAMGFLTDLAEILADYLERQCDEERTCKLVRHEVELPDELKEADVEICVYECSECGERMFSDYRWCPRCGSRVVG